MLTLRRAPQHTGDPADRGSTLVVVLVVMLVLSIGALSGATIVTNTTASLVGSRSNAEARAAADAGLADAVAAARRTSSVCGLTLAHDAPPRYEAATICEGERARFVATGFGADGRSVTVEAVYRFSAEDVGGAGDMVFFGKTTFTDEVLTHTLDDELLSIVIPTGDFTCQAVIPANIILSGNFITRGGCDVMGAVVAGGTMDMSNASDTVRGSVSVAGTGTNIVRGTVGGTLTATGSIEFGWDSKTVGGDLLAAGDVKLSRQHLQGSLTLPSGRTLTMNEGTVAGVINRPASVSPPAAAPTFDPWFDYRYQASDWPGYSVITLAASGSGPGTCAFFNSHPATGWHDLDDLPGPTILDARACSELSSNSGTQPNVALGHNLVLLAKKFNLTQLTFTAASGAEPHVWFIVEDTTANGLPTCSSGRDILINGTVMSAGVTAMAYTPCEIDVAGMGYDSWKGAFYGGSFDYGGGLSFYGDPILLPGMPSGSNDDDGGGGAQALGELLSQRDVP
ncbi:hypothetical protein ACIGCK_10200 [Microbacterium sp. NPDC078428]|uniref:hypothetical protein n=1 Tax=Microbacterium sp. NPDC078428 TaxID=3364190 RepID=UPI0037C856D7